MVANSSYGDSPVSATVGVNTAAPGTPTFYNVTSSAVQVSWSGVANGPYGYTSYQLQRATDH